MHRKKSQHVFAFAAWIAIALSSCARAAGPAPTPGADEARKAWRAISGPTATPSATRESRRLDLGFLEPLFEFIEKHRLAIGIIAGAALAGLVVWLVAAARRRSALSLPRLFAAKATKGDGPRAAVKAESEPSDALYARALEAAATEDWSLASVFLRRARVAQLVETGFLPARREVGEPEIVQAAERAGESPGAYRALARAADAALFGGRAVGAEGWRSLLAAYAEEGGAR